MTNNLLFIHILHHHISIPSILQEPPKFWHSIIPHIVSVDKSCTNTKSGHLITPSRSKKYANFIHILHHHISIPSIFQEPPKFWHSIIPHNVSVDKGCTNTKSGHLIIPSRSTKYVLFIHILHHPISIPSIFQEPPKFWHSIIPHIVSVDKGCTNTKSGYLIIPSRSTTYVLFIHILHHPISIPSIFQEPPKF